MSTPTVSSQKRLFVRQKSGPGQIRTTLRRGALVEFHQCKMTRRLRVRILVLFLPLRCFEVLRNPRIILILHRRRTTFRISSIRNHPRLRIRISRGQDLQQGCLQVRPMQRKTCHMDSTLLSSPFLRHPTTEIICRASRTQNLLNHHLPLDPAQLFTRADRTSEPIFSNHSACRLLSGRLVIMEL